MLTNPEEAQFCKADTSLDPTAVGHGAGKVDAVPQDKTHTVQSPRIERADTKVQYVCVCLCVCVHMCAYACVCMCVCMRACLVSMASMHVPERQSQLCAWDGPASAWSLPCIPAAYLFEFYCISLLT